MQLALKHRCGLRAHRLEKSIRQRPPVPSLDRGGQAVAVLAEAEGQGLLDRRREIRRGQALAQHPGEDDFAVDEDAVAIEDDKIGHAKSFLGLCRCDK